jgi:capsular exopolysaccharide synthesis family protein
MLSKKTSNILNANSLEIDILSGNLMSAAKGKLPKSILVTSSHPKEGRTTTAIAVAKALADEFHARVLLVDADTHTPSIHTIFDVEQTSGLSECFDNDNSEGIINSGIERIDILTAGEKPSHSSRFFANGNIKHLLEEWEQIYDHIIIDTSSVLTTSTPTLLAPHVDGILLVVECERTKGQVLETSQNKLLGSGGNILGIMLNKRRYHIPSLFYRSV